MEQYMLDFLLESQATVVSERTFQLHHDMKVYSISFQFVQTIYVHYIRLCSDNIMNFQSVCPEKTVKRKGGFGDNYLLIYPF